MAEKNVNLSNEASEIEVETSRITIRDTYQIKPNLSDTFKPEKIRKIIQRVLVEKLEGKIYNATETAGLIKEIADEVNVSVKELNMRHYKHVVEVVLGQQLGSGIRHIARCLWDVESDSYTSDVFNNATIFCVCTVFGIYLY